MISFGMGDTHALSFTRPVDPKSPDLNPVDYKMYGEMQQQLYQTNVHDVDKLKQRMLCLAHGLERSVINDIINEWCKHLCAYIRAE